jgi:hypothetical protein
VSSSNNSEDGDNNQQFVKSPGKNSEGDENSIPESEFEYFIQEFMDHDEENRQEDDIWERVPQRKPSNSLAVEINLAENEIKDDPEAQQKPKCTGLIGSSDKKDHKENLYRSHNSEVHSSSSEDHDDGSSDDDHSIVTVDDRELFENDWNLVSSLKNLFSSSSSDNNVKEEPAKDHIAKEKDLTVLEEGNNPSDHYELALDNFIQELMEEEGSDMKAEKDLEAAEPVDRRALLNFFGGGIIDGKEEPELSFVFTDSDENDDLESTVDNWTWKEITMKMEDV